MTNWADVVKNAAPVGAAVIAVAGVWIGARLTRRTTSESFMLQRIFTEMTKRREVAAAYRKALWAFAARVETILNIGQRVAQARADGVDAPHIQYKLEQAQERQDVLRDAFANLELCATIAVQRPARDCMEALTRCFNYCTELQMPDARGQWILYQRQYEELSTELNKEADHFNAIIYATFTPLWRAVLRRAQNKPLPYKVQPHPTELRDPSEGLRPKVLVVDADGNTIFSSQTESKE